MQPHSVYILTLLQAHRPGPKVKDDVGHVGYVGLVSLRKVLLNHRKKDGDITQ
jgi:hypothetical protein